MASTSKDVYERARLARDSRFDGHFYIGVRTTGIYCRPICPANPPKSENVTFFPTAAAASEAGYRPCLRCRPETAPGTPAWAGTSTTVRRGLRLISGGALEQEGIEALSDRLGVSSRHLRRLFQKHLGASPQAVAHTQRLHFAKRLIDDTHLPLGQIALAAGYGSVRRFNDAFLKSYGRAPRDMRKLREDKPAPATRIKLKLSYRDPYNWNELLGFLHKRSTAGVELVDGNHYLRTIFLDGEHAVLKVSNDEKARCLRVQLFAVAVPWLFKVVQLVREVFDVDAPIADINRTLIRDEQLAARLSRSPGIRVPGAWDGFELTVRAILGQQITVAAATTLAGRLAERYGAELDISLAEKFPGLGRIFPTPDVLSTAKLEEIGVIGSRAETIRAVSKAVVTGELEFDPSQEPEKFIRQLTATKGIGDWTAQYVAMRALKNPDAFPAGDLGLLKAIDPSTKASERELLARAEDWRPWRAYAAMLLWTDPH